MKYLTILLTSLFFITGCTIPNPKPIAMDPVDQNIKPELAEKIVSAAKESSKFIDFSLYSDSYRFGGFINENWEVEYIEDIDSINVYNPSIEADSNLEKSQFFIRNFSARSFLTLSTVHILEKSERIVQGKDAVNYTIEKKSGVRDFASQPSWRNQKHNLTDIRYSTQNPSLFFVFSYNPDLDKDVFEAFLTSLIFHNDVQDLSQPIMDADKRISKKPFGLNITQADSPVQPERFSGIHVGVDYEILEGEEDTDVAVYTICSGELMRNSSVNGYGGLAIQSCMIDDKPVTVLYGHIDTDSVDHEVGDYISSGTQLAILGDGFSDETDNERKHLHLGVHKGNQIVLSGYIQNQNQLDNWIDVETLLP